MKKPKSIHPFMRQGIAKAWESNAVIAQIQALIGDDPNKIADRAGRVIYVVLGGCILDGIKVKHPDVPIVNAAAWALYDLAGTDKVHDAQRTAVVEGLEACARLCAVLKQESMTEAAVDLHFALQTGNLQWDAFQAVGVEE